jgi:hypothetical protein
MIRALAGCPARELQLKNGCVLAKAEDAFVLQKYQFLYVT